MQNLDVCKKDSGKIWHRKPSPNDDGRVLSVTNSASSSLSLPSRNIRFLHATFDITGDCFVAGDYQGNVYLFDIHRNRFSLVQKTSTPCTALAFTMRRKTELLVAMSDYSLKCYDTETKELVAWMRGHEAAIHTISVHSSGRYALTSSLDTAQLWDLDTFQRKRKLNIKQNVGIVKVFFLPLSSTIVTCFKDDSIFAWECDTLTCKYQLKVPEGKSPGFKDFSATRDGRMLVGGGRSRFLHMWSLETKRIQQIIELPKKVTCVKQLEFLPNSFDGGSNQTLGILSQDGIMRFIDINTYKQLFDIGGLDERISSVAISPNGRYITAVMDSGNVNMYNVQALSSQLNQPPPPLVKMLKSNKMADTTDENACGAGSRRGTGRRAAGRRGRGNRAPFTANIQEQTETDFPDGLRMDKLMAILKGYGEFPAKYRMFIWRSILRLPENHVAYGALVDKGTHPSYKKLQENYPIKSRKLLRVLQRVLSAMAHWSPIFGETTYLPLMAFPFVKLFQNNQLVCFELMASILTNWCQHWFEYFPNPPINMLSIVENVLAHQDKELLSHLVMYNVTSQTYAWPLMETLFSEVLSREEWLKLFDNVFSSPPAYLVMVVVAYCTTNRGPLLKCTELDDFKFFFHHRNAVDVGEVIREAYRLMDTTPDDIHPQTLLEDYTPLTRGQYPVFNKYPKFIVDYQVQERERIRVDEEDYLRQRQASLELQQETLRRQQEEEAWYRQQQLLVDAEDKRRRLIADEETKLADQRVRLGAMNREVKVKELQLLDATRRKFLAHQQQQKETQLARLDDEIRRKATLRETETKSAVQDVELRNMELQLQRKLLEQELFRGHTEANQKLSSDTDARRRQQELEEKALQSVAWAEEDRQRVARKHMLQQSLAHSDNKSADSSIKNHTEHRQQVDNLEQESKNVQYMQLVCENRKLGQQVEDLMIRLQQEQASDKDGQHLPQEQSYGEAGAGPLQPSHHQHPPQEQSYGEAGAGPLQPSHHSVSHSHEHLHPLTNMQADLPSSTHDYHEAQGASQHAARNDRYLNDSDEASSTQFSLDRGRNTFEERERSLMADVRKLRQKLATESRNKRPPPVYMIDS